MDAGKEALIEAAQLRSVLFPHTVTGSEPFYAIEVPPPDDDSFLCGVAVSDGDGEYSCSDRYTNTFPNDRVLHVEADDRQRVYVRFGFEGIVGVQPKDRAVIKLLVSYTAGDIHPESGSPFSFEYLGSPLEASVEMVMHAMVQAGQALPSMSVLRDLARYPSVYDGNAVFLGEFDFLVRRTFPTLRFLSVCNEAEEERARGPSLDNINTLFVACLSAARGEHVLAETSPEVPVVPLKVATDSLSSTQLAIRTTLLAADDSYRVSFVTPVRLKIRMTVNARVATSYVASDVKSQIAEALLHEFGELAAGSRRGRNRPLYQRVYALLREKVPALSAGQADLTVQISEPQAQNVRPETWR